MRRRRLAGLERVLMIRSVGPDTSPLRRKMATLYETLGVHDGASDDEIKRAYRKAAMRAHPDRNKGREAAAHDAFQEIKQAYAILSDPEQRRVYDAVFAEEMSKLRQREAEEVRAAQEAREARERAERERYERYVAQAMRYAERGHNRDVVFGVLLGRGCDEALAARIADGVAALCASRADASDIGSHSGSTSGAPRERDGAPATSPPGGERAKTARAGQARRKTPASPQGEPGAAEPEAPAESEAASPHAGLFNTLWHGMFGVRP